LLICDLYGGGIGGSVTGTMNATNLTVGQHLTLTGTNGHKLNFRWTAPWQINVGDTASLNYVSFAPSSGTSVLTFHVVYGTATAANTDVAYSNATGIPIYDTTNGANNTNNTNWVFSGAAPKSRAYWFTGGQMFTGNLHIY